MKEEKITTLRQILKVHEERGRLSPSRRDEEERNINYVSQKLTQAVAELMSLHDEIAQGCNPCHAP